MCFSAEASFTSSIILSGFGYASLKVSNKSQWLLAAIPLFFALQQACEGIVWLDLQGDLQHSFWTIWAKNLYLFLALAFWILWIPLSLALAEPQAYRKKLILGVLALGVVVAYLNLKALPPYTLSPQIVGHSIQYVVEAPFYNKFFYLVAISLPCFISSLRYIWIFGLLSVATSILANYFYTTTFTSIWCFMAAVLSASLYAISRANAAVPAALRESKVPIEKNKN